MKTYLITANYNNDITEELSSFGKAEHISLLYNMYSLITDISKEEIMKIEHVISVREEDKCYLFAD